MVSKRDKKKSTPLCGNVLVVEDQTLNRKTPSTASSDTRNLECEMCLNMKITTVLT